MDANLLSLIVLMIGVSVLSFRLTKKTKQLTESDTKLQIANEKLAMYRHFVNNTPVEKFFRFINTVSVDVFDTDIKAMLVKYFNKVFVNLSIEHLARLISDIKATVNCEVIMSAFIKAHEHHRLNLSGLALADAIQRGNDEELSIINDFLERLLPGSKTEQLMTAINAMQNFLDIDLDDHVSSDYKIAMQAELIKLQKRIE